MINTINLYMQPCNTFFQLRILVSLVSLESQKDYRARILLENRIKSVQEQYETKSLWKHDNVFNLNKPNNIRIVWEAAAIVGNTSLNSKPFKAQDLLSSPIGVLLFLWRTDNQNKPDIM